jgi:hypothetical protein
MANNCTSAGFEEDLVPRHRQETNPEQRTWDRRQNSFWQQLMIDFEAPLFCVPFGDGRLSLRHVNLDFGGGSLRPFRRDRLFLWSGPDSPSLVRRFGRMFFDGNDRAQARGIDAENRDTSSAVD